MGGVKLFLWWQLSSRCLMKRKRLTASVYGEKFYVRTERTILWGLRLMFYDCDI